VVVGPEIGAISPRDGSPSWNGSVSARVPPTSAGPFAAPTLCGASLPDANRIAQRSAKPSLTALSTRTRVEEGMLVTIRSARSWARFVVRGYRRKGSEGSLNPIAKDDPIVRDHHRQINIDLPSRAFLGHAGGTRSPEVTVSHGGPGSLCARFWPMAIHSPVAVSQAGGAPKPAPSPPDPPSASPSPSPSPERGAGGHRRSPSE